MSRMLWRGPCNTKGVSRRSARWIGILLCQWVGEAGAGRQQFFVGNGDVGDLAAGGPGAERQVHQPPGDGSPAARRHTARRGSGRCPGTGGRTGCKILLKMMAPRLGAVARADSTLRLPPVTSFTVSSIRFCSSRIFWAHSTTYRPTAVGYRRRLYRRNKAKPKVRSHSARNLLSAEGRRGAPAPHGSNCHNLQWWKGNNTDGCS